MMVAKAGPSPGNGTYSRHSIVLIRDGVDDHVAKTAAEFASRNIDIKECLWEQVNVQEDSLYLVFDSVEKHLLLEPQPQLFETVNALLSAKCRVLWVLLQDSPDPAISAYKGLVNAFIRVLRRESNNTGIVSLDFRQPALCPEMTAKVVADVVQKRFWPAKEDTPSLEPEFAYENGRVLIPRVKPDSEFLQWARRRMELGAAEETETALYQGDRVLKAEVGTPGLLSSLRFVDHDMLAALGPSQIMVKAEAHGLNYKDVSLALSQRGPGAHMAGEVAGVVTAVGDDMRNLYQVGDRVMGFGSQPFSNLSRIHGHQAHKTPGWMSTTVAASIPHAYVTAYHCIMGIARLERGQSILIQAASGGVGQAAIQLAQHVGAAINGKGVDLVLNSSAGEALRDSLDCVKPLGTFIELGKSEMQQGSQLSMAAFNRSITFHVFDLETLSARDPRRVYRMLGDIISLLESKALRPIHPLTSYPINQIEDAFRFLGSRKHTGKVVLQVEPMSMVKCLPSKPLPMRVRKDGTYVAAGGLGDLTSRICVFLASRGAGHVVSFNAISRMKRA
jgi:NADPH:quinone reductase-like Zn-dependent oxidoreductase